MNIEDDYEDFDEGLCNIEKMSSQEYRFFLCERAKTDFGVLWNEFVEYVFKIAEHYSIGNDDERNFIRETIKKYKYVTELLLSIISERQWCVVSVSEEKLLRLLLICASINDRQSNLSELEIVLSNLYYGGKKSGIDVDKIYKEISTISSGIIAGVESAQDPQSMKDMLATFEPADFNVFETTRDEC